MALFHSFYGWATFHGIYSLHFHYSSTHGPLGGFHVLGIVNSAALNIGVSVSFLISWWLWFSYSVLCDSLWPHGLQHAWLPCPSLSSGVCSNSCPLSWWYYLTISSSAFPFFCLQSFPESGSFLRLFTSGGQSIGASASASVLPMNIQGWFSFRINWFDLLAVQGTLKSILQYHNSKASVL